ncbi:MAG: undecaprenyl-diphosphate phosphatase [Lachnospiraceae bacterium]|nr:undecaprenyl-diphosphate phosphatase [Lachnospiraceae bacterium]
MSIIEILKVIVFGIVEGFTEWLPISSTAHLMILDEIIRLDVSPEFKNVFITVIQVGAVIALIVLYFRKLNPFDSKKKPEQKKATWRLWLKIAIATVPAAILGFLADDWISERMENGLVISITLILFGIAFLVVERVNRYKQPTIMRLGKIDYMTAFYIGLFQVLALIPGTSRSGATILGAMLLGCARPIAAEFSFFLGIPTILGAGLLRLVKYGGGFSSAEVVYMILGCVVAFFVSLYSIKFLMSWLKKNNFNIFGYYRIVIGIIILIWYIISSLLK